MKHRLVEVGVAHIVGEEAQARGARPVAITKQLGHSLGAERELPMAGGGVDAQRLHHRDHVGALGMERRKGALQRIPAVEQQHAIGATLAADRIDHGGDAIHAADAAIGFGERLEVGRGEHVGIERRGGDAERRQEILAYQVRQLAPGLANAQIERGLAKIDRLQLRMTVGHVQQSQLPLGREAQQVFLAQRALGRGAAQPAAQASYGGRGCGHLQKVSSGNHAWAFIGRRLASASAWTRAPQGHPSICVICSPDFRGP